MDRKYKIEISCSPKQLKRIMELNGIQLNETDMAKFNEALEDESSCSWKRECSEEQLDEFIESYFNKKTPAVKQEKKIDYAKLAYVSALILVVINVMNLMRIILEYIL